MCLQQCPTYQLSQDEGESPRGRISLVQGLISGQLAYSAKLETHLGNCVRCRACERICPSLVSFGELIDGAQTYIERGRHQAHARRTRLLALVTERARLRQLTRLLRVYQRSGLRALARGSGLLRLIGLQRLESQLPELESPREWDAFYPPLRTHRGDVALFTGCIADTVDPQTTRAAIRVLTTLGYGVHVPRAQVCCGALHLHNGAPEAAEALARTNVAAFNLAKVQAIISTASGCGATLSEYAKLEPGAADFAGKVVDISTFLAADEWPKHVALKPLQQRVAVHDPCSLGNVLRQADKPYALLRRIPDIELVALPGNSRCCGAAGSYMLTHAQTADRLRDDKIDHLAALNVRTLVSSNIGCALHLTAGLRARKIPLEVIHPVTLLARQLDGA
jgi:glycolate oxidase iron-sulfur subunit